MKAAKIQARRYRDNKRPKQKWVLDLPAYGKGRLLFKTRNEAEQEQDRQRELLECQGKAALEPRRPKNCIGARAYQPAACFPALPRSRRAKRMPNGIGTSGP